jgi:hypothetical protein
MKTNKKGGITAKKTSIHSKSMTQKYEHGHLWQSEVSELFEKNGFRRAFFPVNDGLGNRKADYQYDGVWVEAKTYIGDSDVTKILRLKPFLDAQNIEMVIMCDFIESDIVGKKHTKVIAQLRNEGIEVFCGIAECTLFVSNEKALKGIVNELPGMAMGINLPFASLYKNKYNRDLVDHNGPKIQDSIKENGFFTQFNIVPMGPKDRASRGIPENDTTLYVLFEGHNRYHQLEELQSKGYKIENVPCVLADWFTSDDIELLHKILLTTNTTSKNWKLRDYVKSTLSFFTDMKNQDAIDTYTWIQDWMKIAKKQNWGESTPVYLFCHTTSKAFGDMDAIKNGTFRISKSIYQKEVYPLLNLISELILDTEKEINGSFVKEFIVDIRVKEEMNLSLKKVLKIL